MSESRKKKGTGSDVNMESSMNVRSSVAVSSMQVDKKTLSKEDITASSEGGEPVSEQGVIPSSSTIATAMDQPVEVPNVPAPTDEEGSHEPAPEEPAQSVPLELGSSELDPLMAKKMAYAQKKAKKRAEEKELQEIAMAMASHEDEEEPGTNLLDRHDSELTPKQMVEKDIMMYDLLLSNEELMDMPDDKGRRKNLDDEEEDEEEEEDEDNGPILLFEQDTDGETEGEEGQEDGQEDEDDIDGVSAAGTDVGGDPDDPDNIVNMMMLTDGGEEDEFRFLLPPHAEDGAGDGVESLDQIEGVVGIHLSDETKTFLEVEKDTTEWRERWVWLSTKRVRLHMYIYAENSEFAPHYDAIKNYPDFAILLGLDNLQQTKHPFFICLTPEARNYVMNPPKKRRVFKDKKKEEEEQWNKLASILPRKWRNLGSHLEIDAENIKNSRPLLTVYAYRYAEHFGADTKFEDSKFKEDSACRYSGFDSISSDKYPGVERIEVDKAIQVNPGKVEQESQTGFSFKRNKMVQHKVQEVTPEEAEEAITSKTCINFFTKARHPIEKALQQNEMLNVLADDYRNLKATRGHEVEFNNESVLLQEYQTYTEQRHSKGRCVTCMKFHPLLDEVVMMSFTEDVTFDQRIEFHSKTLMDPNFVLIWDLKDPSKPQLMLDAPSDVFSFMVSPSDPQLVCGGCENGQVVLWDCGKHYVELRNRIQDRKRKDSDGKSKSSNFLEKLKDSAEKYVCPLIPPAGLSNLDSSHKRVVTCVHWLPPHVELGKNGSLYDNSWGGRSAQFFSVSGDSTCRVWDIRVQKLGLDEFDVAPVSAIKVNPWAHLENNVWKYSTKYTLDDGTGSMYCTIMSLSEGKLGEGPLSDFGSRTMSIGSSGASASAMSSDAIQSGGGSTSGSQVKLKHGKHGPGKSQSQGQQQVVPHSQMSLHGGPSSSTSHHGHGGSARDGQRGSVGNSGSSVGVGSGATGTEGSEGGGVHIKARVTSSANNAQTSFFASTEKGQVALVDWLRNKDGSINPDAAGNKICQNLYIRCEMDGAITDMSRSPFHHELILIVGGGTVSLWKENAGYPILATLGGDSFIWSGCWSNTRPGVFFTGTREGSLQVWDLMEKSHAPVLTQQITPGRLVSVATPKTLTQKKHFLAAGDSQGNLFVLLIPRWYTKQKSGENATIMELMNREETRMNGWVADMENRQERITKIHEDWKESRRTKTEGEIKDNELNVESRLRVEYQEFLEFQGKLAGKLKRDEPQLPTDELDIDHELDALIAAAEAQETEKWRDKLRESLAVEGEEEEGEGEEK